MKNKKTFNKDELRHLACNFALTFANGYTGTFDDWYDNIYKDWRKIANQKK